MSPALATFVFEAINFVLLVAALGWVFSKPMRKLLDDELAERARADKAGHQRADDMEKAQAELSRRLGVANEDTERIREQARSQAEREAQRILEMARAQIAEERARLVAEQDSRRRAEIDRLAAEVGTMVSKLVLDLFAAGSGSESDVAFARAARVELSELAARATGPLLIECAHPLSDEVRAALRTALGPALDRASVRLVPELIAGVRVAGDAGLVDASARGLAYHAKASLGRERAEAHV